MTQRFLRRPIQTVFPQTLRVSSRPSPRTRCAFCLDSLRLSPILRCGRCGVALHRECTEEIAHCPTLGCPRWVATFTPGFGPLRLRVRRAEPVCRVDGSSTGRTLASFLERRPFDLTGLDLDGIDLAGTDLRFARMRGARLTGARLREANLLGADLRKADLRGADLSGIRGDHLNLTAADLRSANLTGARLLHARMKRACLANAILDGAQLPDRPAHRPWFGSALLRRAWQALAPDMHPIEPDLRVLRVLRLRGDLSADSIAGLCGLHRTTVRLILGRLEIQGLVWRVDETWTAARAR